MKRLLSLVVVLASLCLCAGVRAAALDNRVPREALVYVGWAGADALGPQYVQSNLKSIIDASGMKRFVSTQLPQLLGATVGRDPQAAANIIKVQTALGVVWRHPTAFYFCPVDFSNPQTPSFRFGIICDAGADAATIADVIKDTLANTPPPPDLPVNLVQDGNAVIITFGKADTAADLRAGGGLAAVATYTKAAATAKFPGNPALVCYVDAPKILATINDGVNSQAGMPPETKTRVNTVIDALGVRSLTQVYMAAGFENKNWSQRGFIGINGPRNGVLSLLTATPLSDGALSVVPRNAAAFSAARLDPAKLFAEVRTVITNIDPSARQEFEGAIAAANQTLGLDIDKDLLATLGDEWTFYRAPLVEDGGLNMALVHKLKDPAAFTKSLTRLEELFNEQVEPPFRVNKMTTGKIECSAVVLPLGFSIAWTVRNGFLYVSSLPALPGAIAQVESQAPSIVTSDAYKAAMALLPQGVKPTSVGFANPARLYPEIYQFVIGLVPLMRYGGIEPPMDLLPDPAAVRAFMPPGAAISWSDADGVHVAGSSAFPGAEILGGQQMGTGGVAVASLGTAILLPSLGKSRELANRSVDAANLRGIAQSCVIWAADNQDQMPDHMGRLIAGGAVSPKQFVNRWSGTQPLEFTDELQQLAKTDFTKFAAQVDAHCDYVYLGKGTKNDADASVVLAYDKPGPWLTDGLNMAFKDGHAEFVRWAGVPQTLEPTNAYLKKLGLPEVNVEALMKAAPAGARLP